MGGWRVEEGMGGKKRTLSLCFRASAAGVGFRRSTARTCHKVYQHLDYFLPHAQSSPRAAKKAKFTILTSVKLYSILLDT